MRATLRVAVVLLILGGSCVSGAAQQEEGSTAALAGLWGMQQLYGPIVRGEITLDGRAAQWRARIAGYDVPVARDADAITFALPGKAGQFRGHRSADGRSIVGHWIQPASLTFNVPYATPVELAESSPGVWSASVAPLDERLTLYLWIEPTADGAVTALIRNPEFNFRSTRSYRVERNKQLVTFSNTSNPRDQFQGTYDETNGRLTVRFPGLPLEYTLSRHKEDEAVGFLPRTGPAAKYVYAKPIVANDGWQTASLPDVGLDQSRIAPLIEKILTSDPRTNPLDIQSLLIARNGKLVLEEYFYGFGPQRPHDMRSASKTFAPLLVGAATEHGAKIAPTAPVFPLFAKYKEFANLDARKAKLTLHHLMTMTSGLACDDNDDDSPGNEDRMQNQEEQPDWYKYTLDLPLARDPGGEKAVYCSAAINLIGGVITNATGAWLPELFYQRVAAPLQFQSYYMNLMPLGDAYLGGGLYLRPRDQLKLGQLYLSGGLWNGRRVVSKEWVAASLAEHSTFEPAFGVDHGYGYAWHLHHVKIGDQLYRQYAAEGNGGQLVVVFPELDLVVAVTGGSYGNYRLWSKWGVELLPQAILPAVSPTAAR